MKAAPWWWTQFTEGNDAFDNTSNYEKWMALYASSAQAGEDVWISSFTWGTGNNGPVNGFFGDNELGGVNQVYLRRKDRADPAPVRALGDGDNRVILDIAASGLPIELSPPDASLDGFTGRSHHKAIMLGNRSLMIGSANMTAGGFSSQPNNMTIFRNMPELNRAFRREFQEQFSGTHFDNSPSERNHFTSPAGNRVSAYFAPDDNFNISLPSGESGLKLDDVLEKHTREANESVHYMFNVMFLGDLSSTLQEASGDKLVEGVVDNGADGIIDNLRSDHTSRDANTFYDGEMHHKVMIFDQEIVAFGSANHTRSAMFRTIGDRNEENLVVVHDFRMGRRYMQEYNRVMSRLDEENVGQEDTFDDDAPPAPTNLVASNISDESNSLELSWDAPSDPGDFSRYYVFVTDYELDSAQQIGDGIDNDGDGLVDEDPRGNADGFASGPSLSNLNPNDDDADGRIDEDQWLPPEKQVKADAPGDVTSTTLNTYNVEETLPNNQNLWVGLVAVDRHGNESEPAFFGPVQSLPSDLNIQPTIQNFRFVDDVSQTAGETSTVRLTVSNDSSASESITKLNLDFGTDTNSFTTRQGASSLSLDLEEEGTEIGPGEVGQFVFDVNNPAEGGPSRAVRVEAVDESGNASSELQTQQLTIESTNPFEGIDALSVSGGGKTITSFDGTSELGVPPYDLEIELAEEPDTDVVMFWDTERAPDGPGGSTSDHRVELTGSGITFEGTISDTDEIDDEDTFQFIFIVDGQRVDRSGSSFEFSVDRFVSRPGITGVESAGFGSVELGINGITDGDFLEYRVYYSTSSPVSTDDSVQSESQIDPGTINIDDLDPGSTYHFALSAVDEEGNESSLSDEVQATTQQSVALDSVRVVDRDQNTEAEQLDGSESFRVQPLTVEMEFGDTVGNVRVFYDVGDNPDGPGGSNTEDRKVEANGKGTVWEAGIPSTDDEITEGVTLKFVVVTDDRVFTNDGVPFQYQYVESPPEVTGLSVADTGGGQVELNWTPETSFGDFSQYRIFYRQGTDTPTSTSPSWGPSDDGGLTLSNTDQTTVRNLSPGVNYRFRIGIVDQQGRVGPLSTTVEGRTTSTGVLLLSEVARQSNPRWVELTSLSPNVDLTEFALTDLDGNTDVIATETTTLDRGERARVFFGSGTSESDQTGDRNGNGVLDIYRNSMSSFALSDTMDQLVVQATSGETVDAIAYRERPGQAVPGGESTDLNTLVSLGQWNGSDSSSLVNLYTRASLSRTAVAARRSNLVGDLLDRDGREDWRLSARSTPGRSNQFLDIDDVEVADVPDEDRDYFTRRVDQLDGGGTLKNTTNHQFTISFNQDPVNDTGFILWYDTSVTPGGLTSPGNADSIPINSGYQPNDNRLNVMVPLAGLDHGDQVRFGLSVVPDPTAPSALDETFFDRNNEGYRFTIDDTGPRSPSNPELRDRTSNGLIIGWNPLEEAPDDFRSYRVYFDTGSVTSESSYFARNRVSSLSDHRIGQAELPIPIASDTWNIRVGSVDQVGNGNTFGPPGNRDSLSDTLSVKRFRSISVEDLYLDPGGRSPDSTTRMPAERIRIRAVFDRRTSNPRLVWDQNDVANLPSAGTASDSVLDMSHVAGGEYRTSIPANDHADEIQFVFDTDGGSLTNDGGGYRYLVDNQASPAVSDFRADTIQVTNFENATSDLSVNWEPLPSSVNDFGHYVIAYNRGDTVSTESNRVGPDKLDHLSDRRVGSATVQGLDRAETYTLGVYWKDVVGNQSLLSDTYRIQTVDAQPTEDPAFDGKFYATALDGSEYLRKRDIRIEFEFSQKPAYPGRVRMRYNIGAEPGEDGTETVPMSRVSETVFRGWIPEDERMTEGTEVSYIIEEGPWQIRPSQGLFSFKIDATPAPQLSNVQISDDGSFVRVTWNPISDGDDFSEYRIRYRKPGEDSWTIYDGDDNDNLTDYRVGSVYLEALDADANYYVNITPVDKMGRVNYLPSDHLLLRNSDDWLPTLSSTGGRIFNVDGGETLSLRTKLLDEFDSPWVDKTIRFTSSHSEAVFSTTGDTAYETSTGYEGEAGAVLRVPDVTSTRYILVRVSLPDDRFFRRDTYLIRVRGDVDLEETEQKTVPFR